MEHSMFVSLVLILMLFALAVFVILIYTLNKIRDELNGLKSEFVDSKKLTREKKYIQFRLKLNGLIHEKYIKETMKNQIQEQPGGANDVEADVIDGGNPPKDPGPKQVTIEAEGQIDISQD